MADAPIKNYLPYRIWPWKSAVSLFISWFAIILAISLIIDLADASGGAYLVSDVRSLWLPGIVILLVILVAWFTLWEQKIRRVNFVCRLQPDRISFQQAVLLADKTNYQVGLVSIYRLLGLLVGLIVGYRGLAIDHVESFDLAYDQVKFVFIRRTAFDHLFGLSKIIICPEGGEHYSKFNSPVPEVCGVDMIGDSRLYGISSLAQGKQRIIVVPGLTVSRAQEFIQEISQRGNNIAQKDVLPKQFGKSSLIGFMVIIGAIILTMLTIVFMPV